LGLDKLRKFVCFKQKFVITKFVITEFHGSKIISQKVHYKVWNVRSIN